MALLDLASRILGLMALVAAISGSIERTSLPNWARMIALGAAFGTAASICMLFPVTFPDGTSVNGRSLFLAFSAAFGGPVAVGVAVSLTSLVHLAMNSIPLSRIIESTIVAATVGLGWRYFIHRQFGYRYPGLLTLGFGVSLISLLLLRVPTGQGVSILMKTYPVTLIVSLVTAVILGRFIEREMRRLRTERRWHNDAFTDALTGLANKRAFQLDYQDALESSQPTSLIVLDIDHFKQVNDSYVHATGDAVLANFASLSTGCCSSGSTPYRLGGEEFAVIAMDVSLNDALVSAETIRRIIAAGVQSDKANIPAITISAGVVSSFAKVGSEDLVSAADAALYYAKSAGRNRVVSWREVSDQIDAVRSENSTVVQFTKSKTSETK